jgi:iron-sulfur cluster assembly protein
MITISPKALNRIRDIRAEHGHSQSAWLRIGVISGGCSGLTYELDFDESFKPDTADASQNIFDFEDVKLVIDMKSFLYLAGTQLDYSDGLQGKGFHFNNPNAARTCSCGESFSV